MNLSTESSGFAFAQFTFLTQRLLWAALLMFLAWTIVFGAFVALVVFRLYHPMAGDLGMCGEILANPTRSILSIGLPIGGLASIALLILSRSGVGAKRPVVIVVVATMICLLGLVVFDLWLETIMPGTDMSVWWMFK